LKTFLFVIIQTDIAKGNHHFYIIILFIENPIKIIMVSFLQGSAQTKEA